MRYRLIIAAEARQLPPLTPGWHEFPPLSLDELAAWCGGKKFTNDSGDYIVVPQDDNRAWPGDWIVKDVQGQFHKVAREDFAASFEPVARDRCPACGGGGLVKLTDDVPQVCPDCKGTGLEQP